VQNLFDKYIDTFKGLSQEIWLLAGITLINRAGMMVIPFLSIYLTKEIGLTYQQVGWVMTCFGLGSLIGAWTGGKLTDRIGGYKVMFGSFILGGFGYIAIQYLHNFQSLCIGVFLLTLMADAFRPALFVAMSNYSKPENKTRSVTLIRLAINLGMSMGPAVGGALILYFGYASLFWIDGITNILAGIFLIALLNPKKRKVLDEQITVANPLSPYKDFYFILLLAGLYIFTIVFLQYFSSMPVYYREVKMLTEGEIGLLMGMNGMIIFLFEMPFVQYFESKNYNKIKLLIIGIGLLAMSFFILPFVAWTGIIVFSIIFMTIGEMLVFPFGNALAVERAKKGKQGTYMALFSMNFSVAHIFGHNIGMQSIDHLGFDNTWLVVTGVALLGMFVLAYLVQYARKKN
jgi:predicted MFS family arabinose efflux permease